MRKNVIDLSFIGLVIDFVVDLENWQIPFYFFYNKLWTFIDKVKQSLLCEICKLYGWYIVYLLFMEKANLLRIDPRYLYKDLYRAGGTEWILKTRAGSHWVNSCIPSIESPIRRRIRARAANPINPYSVLLYHGIQGPESRLTPCSSRIFKII